MGWDWEPGRICGGIMGWEGGYVVGWEPGRICGGIMGLEGGYVVGWEPGSTGR